MHLETFWKLSDNFFEVSKNSVLSLTSFCICKTYSENTHIQLFWKIRYEQNISAIRKTSSKDFPFSKFMIKIQESESKCKKND